MNNIWSEGKSDSFFVTHINLSPRSSGAACWQPAGCILDVKLTGRSRERKNRTNRSTVVWIKHVYLLLTLKFPLFIHECLSALKLHLKKNILSNTWTPFTVNITETFYIYMTELWLFLRPVCCGDHLEFPMQWLLQISATVFMCDIYVYHSNNLIIFCLSFKKQNKKKLQLWLWRELPVSLTTCNNIKNLIFSWMYIEKMLIIYCPLFRAASSFLFLTFNISKSTLVISLCVSWWFYFFIHSWNISVS